MSPATTPVALNLNNWKSASPTCAHETVFGGPFARSTTKWTFAPTCVTSTVPNGAVPQPPMQLSDVRSNVTALPAVGSAMLDASKATAPSKREVGFTVSSGSAPRADKETSPYAQRRNLDRYGRGTASKKTLASRISNLNACLPAPLWTRYGELKSSSRVALSNLDACLPAPIWARYEPKKCSQLAFKLFFLKLVNATADTGNG